MSTIETTTPSLALRAEAAGVFVPRRGQRRPDWSHPDEYPRMFNVSAGFMYKRVIAADFPTPPEYLTIRMPSGDARSLVSVVQWNSLWQSAQFRRRHFDETDLPTPMRRVAERGDLNVIFVPRTRSRYHEYAPLYHLLPERILRRHGLPMIRAGSWPFTIDWQIDDLLPPDFAVRLASAWADAVWRHLMPGSAMSGFTGRDPVRVLAHNLDFWLPAATAVVTEILDLSRPIGDGWTDPLPATLDDGSVLENALVVPPRKGVELWRGAEDATETLAWVVETADKHGRLRAMLDAVRSHRATDDFSDRWTYEREDFERKLHHKRAKAKVVFMELPDTTPVHGPESEVVGEMVTASFLATLDPTARTVTVMLSSGHTNLADLANQMGYANHSAISKQLSKIRRQAHEFFGTSDAAADR